MDQDLPLFPDQASTIAPEVDALFLFILGVTLVFTSLIFALVIAFAVKYRRRPGREVGAQVRPTPC